MPPYISSTFSPLDDQKKIILPLVIMQNDITDASNQIPSRKEVKVTPTTDHFCKEFQENEERWETIVLVGRDCIETQWQKQYRSDENSLQLVAKTPLVCTLVGSPHESGTLTGNLRRKKTGR